ncbi:VIT1/CCC1 family predicted Fe2+/Mn2+ transporter [Rhizobium leguminosarum]|uniref:VIT1/CCC1 family predicted Fe2+/Mn2+ transporter n=2 Tax=Rhizobium/Agrobacterium group TaxID=227290 RepID=A0AAE2MI65_RHILE|nr:VIT1/CCC1 family predicted Fe2+/Mn2+ transporter [Rhizobium leguminosarum]MBB4433528.1 VIT1/CCC1 family predicted Fe2+/Mn2+ transporter [Rhizobium esperanzae]MBB4294343.1 VIT1/CCC1 family predicted Fe2+/Mn2+ transporter [Rhizobium leguminosarum]MBB4305740.1 VIT1/CCC1 family predicted Fe2+/Mn2+ transporter [Rhizobium leguminosarum]MBB4418683.1 VIT1/CCC1 family predicted Fe2+/Mn2+ transporter [Rhizobium leguminosarum]
MIFITWGPSMTSNPIGHITNIIDPGDALGEVLFGLIMALTLTVGSRLVFEDEGLDVHELIVATIGCNVAWGIIDAVLFILGTTFYKSRRLRLFRQIKAARSETAALKMLTQEFPIEEAPFSAKAADTDALYRSLLTLASRADPRKASLSKDELLAAIAVFFLVSVTSIPAVTPFLLIDNAHLALRVSNLFLIILLFVTGYAWAEFSGGRPFHAGMTMTCLGLLLVAIAIALGG